MITAITLSGKTEIQFKEDKIESTSNVHFKVEDEHLKICGLNEIKTIIWDEHFLYKINSIHLTDHTHLFVDKKTFDDPLFVTMSDYSKLTLISNFEKITIKMSNFSIVNGNNKNVECLTLESLNHSQLFGIFVITNLIVTAENFSRVEFAKSKGAKINKSVRGFGTIIINE